MFAKRIYAVCSGEWKQHKGLKYLCVLLYCTLVPAVLDRKGVVQWLVQRQWHAGEILNCCIDMVSFTKIKENSGHNRLCSYSLSSQSQVSRECLVTSAHPPSIDQVTAMMLQPKMEYTAPRWQSTHGLGARDSLCWWLAMSRRSFSLCINFGFLLLHLLVLPLLIKAKA